MTRAGAFIVSTGAAVAVWTAIPAAQVKTPTPVSR